MKPWQSCSSINMTILPCAHPQRMWAETHLEIPLHTILFHHLIALLSLTAFVMGNRLSWQTLSLFIAQRLVQKPLCKNIWRRGGEDVWWRLFMPLWAGTEGKESLLFLLSSDNMSAWCKGTPWNKWNPTFGTIWYNIQLVWLRTLRACFYIERELLREICWEGLNSWSLLLENTVNHCH